MPTAATHGDAASLPRRCSPRPNATTTPADRLPARTPRTGAAAASARLPRCSGLRRTDTHASQPRRARPPPAGDARPLSPAIHQVPGRLPLERLPPRCLPPDGHPRPDTRRPDTCRLSLPPAITGSKGDARRF